MTAATSFGPLETVCVKSTVVVSSGGNQAYRVQWLNASNAQVEEDPHTLSGSGTVTFTDNVIASTQGTWTVRGCGSASCNGSNLLNSETFTVGKTATTTTVTCSGGPFSYTGSAHTPCTATVTGAGGLNQSLTVSYTDNVNPGIATASASFTENANYLGSSDSENFTIGKATTTTTVACAGGPFSYTGSAHTPCTATVTGAGGLNQSLTVSYTDNVNPGTATASASFTENANYFGSSDSENFEVEQADLTITAEDQTKTYGDTVVFDTTSPSADFSVSGLVNADTVTSVTLTSAGAAASATVALSPYAIVIGGAAGSGLANYDIHYVNGELEVERPTTITAEDQTKTYGDTVVFDTTSPSADFSVSGLVNADTVTSVTLTSAGAAASATVALSPYAIVIGGAAGSGLANYDIHYVNGELEVEQADLTITAEDQPRPTATRSCSTRPARRLTSASAAWSTPTRSPA